VCNANTNTHAHTYSYFNPAAYSRTKTSPIAAPAAESVAVL
jgi:hypothetical protein